MFIGVLAGLAAGFFWGLCLLAPKVLADFSSAQIAFGRFFFFGLAALVSLLADRNAKQLWNRNTLFWGVILSLSGYSLYYWMLSQSVQFADITTASLIIGMIPLTVAVCSRSRPKQMGLFRFSLLLITIGILALNYDVIFHPQLGSYGQQHSLGVLLAIAALGMWTYFAIANAQFLVRTKVNNVAWTNLLGCLTFVGISFVTAPEFLLGEHGYAEMFSGPRAPLFLFWSAVLGLGSTWLTTFLWNFCSQRVPTGLAGQLIISETIFALLFGFIYDHRLPFASEWAAMGFLIAGVLLGVYSFRNAKRIDAPH
jgi:drug/metabolite transporter (DMT)-like permease